MSDEVIRRHEREQLAVELEQSARCIAIQADACDLDERQEELVGGVVVDLLAAAEFVEPDGD
ncbi:hypothetical protein [Halostella litorea]|uniref:hypothetical protein n=1 Tax=Halostella litorea TaxID=2528831 RepID=UPI0010922794|nr:hypothetical protein [Halostella litorea]